MNYSEIVSTSRNAFDSGTTKSIDFRKLQLKALLRFYIENFESMVKAVGVDLRKHRQEAITAEINVLINDLHNILSNLKNWTKQERPSKALVNIFDKVYVCNDPYGVVLILGTWNYPLQLILVPLAGAIAAGNCVIIKPSEVAPATANFLKETLPKYLDAECYQVVCGGVAETTELLKERFDYIFYTGSTYVGRIVHKAANKYLTPVTLELGGKSPVYIDDTVNFDIAVRRIIWGKCLNAGQTCIAPDYLLCTQEVQKKFLITATKILNEFYASDKKSSLDYCRIINDKHFQRIVELMKSGTVAIGGEMDRDEKFIEPTIIIDVEASDLIMKEEIFGPVLPIFNIDSAEDAIKFINRGEKPLALYIFTTNKKVIDLFLSKTSSGGVTINDTILHFATDNVPFGGVGFSGMGHYHGKYSFDTFTHKKTCLQKNYNSLAERLAAARYPPYSDLKIKILTQLLKKRHFKYLRGIFSVAILVLIAIGIKKLTSYCTS